MIIIRSLSNTSLLAHTKRFTIRMRITNTQKGLG